MDMATNLATVKEATEALGISRSTLWRRIRSGDISTISRGGRRLVQLSSRRTPARAKFGEDLPPFTESHPMFRLVGAGRGGGKPGARDKHAILDE